VIETLSADIPGIIPVEPCGGKEARAAILEPKVEAGNWYLPEGAEWLDDWCEEFAMFPHGRWDDRIDATSQAETRFLLDSDVHNARLLLGIK
jgi:predicted phage terminase large subunit-like protein